MRKKEIVQKFLMKGFLLDPTTAIILEEQIKDKNALRNILEKIPHNVDVVTPKILLQIGVELITIDPRPIVETKSSQGLVEPTKKEESSKVAENKVTLILPQEEVEVLLRIPKKSPSTGVSSDFVKLFQSRFELLKEILFTNPRLKNVTPLGSLAKNQKLVTTFGMISDLRTTQKGTVVISLEDPESPEPLRVLFMDNSPYYDFSRSLLQDTVIGIKGNYQPGLKEDSRNAFTQRVLFGREIYRPGIPPRPKTRRKGLKDCRIAFISDLHIGNIHFNNNKFESFLKFLDSKPAEKIYYLVIVGDLVDGIGLYPDHRKALNIDNLYDQYGFASELLEKVPSRIQILIIPGEHDATRIALPQPPIALKFTKKLQKLDNITYLGNPALIRLCSRTIMMFHGQGLEKMIAHLRSDPNTPTTALAESLEYRHLSPTWGQFPSCAPEWTDFMVIKTVPDIFIAGHLHRAHIGAHGHVKLATCGTFENPHKRRPLKGIQASLGEFLVVNLRDLTTRIVGV